MGVVYRARQISLNRIVAIKMILGGHLANAAEMQRFRAEAETAAHLQHPNIVAIHEVGEHAGQPFFSMDLVEGRNLAQMARDERLPSRMAAGYLKTITEAVQYAHSRGVLHRDLKPSNILIDETDQPLITDFGLAKRLASDSQCSTFNPQLTQTGQVLGSPSFIPPEQAAGRKGAIGPASDVYSLGAILYHLLTARPPFVAETLTQTLRLVAETEPVSPRLLNASVPRDLETICLKCLEKDPKRRYATAQELAEDLNRFLRDEPIQARPVGQAERFWRWCRRNRALAETGAAVLLLLLAVAIGSPIAAIRFTRANKQAVATEKKAQTEARKSLQTIQLVTNLLEAVGPSRALGRDTAMLREILDKTAERVGKDLKDQPDAEADLRIILGKTYADLGLITNALAMTQETLRLRRLYLGPTNTAVAGALANLGALLYQAGDLAGAERTDREALAMRTNLLGNMDMDVAMSLNNLGVTVWNQGKLAEAEELQYRALEIRKKLLGETNIDVGMSLANLAGVHWARGNFPSAEARMSEALKMFRSQLPQEHPKIATLRGNLATMLSMRGELAAAAELNATNLALARKVFKGDHPQVALSLTKLGIVLLNRGDLDGAKARLQEALDIYKRMGMNKDSDVADALAGLGIVLTKKGDWGAAQENLQQALAMRIEVMQGEENMDVVDSLDALGVLAIARDDLDGAKQHLIKAVYLARKAQRSDHPGIVPPLWHLAWVLQKNGDATNAVVQRGEALDISLKQGVYGAWRFLSGIYDLADILQTQQKFAEAEPLLVEAADYAQKNLGDHGNPLRDTFQRLVLFYEAWDRSAPNTGNASHAADWRKKLEEREPQVNQKTL